MPVRRRGRRQRFRLTTDRGAPSFNDPIECRDLRTGAVQGQASRPPASLVNAAGDTHVYLATDDNLLVVTPAGACA